MFLLVLYKTRRCLQTLSPLNQCGLVASKFERKSRYQSNFLCVSQGRRVCFNMSRHMPKSRCQIPNAKYCMPKMRLAFHLKWGWVGGGGGWGIEAHIRRGLCLEFYDMIASVSAFNFQWARDLNMA